MFTMACCTSQLSYNLWHLRVCCSLWTVFDYKISAPVLSSAGGSSPLRHQQCGMLYQTTWDSAVHYTLLKPGTHWRQSWIQHGQLCGKSTVSLWPGTHWRQSWIQHGQLCGKSTVSLWPGTHGRQSRPYRQQSWTYMATVDFVAVFGQSRPCWIQLCYQCVPGFRNT